MKNSTSKRYLNRRKLYRNILGIFSLSGIMFTFQACYGAPQDFGQDVLIQGKVTSAAGSQSIKGIKVQVNQTGQYTQSAFDGTWSIYCERLSEYNLTFIDTDGSENGVYQVADTTVLLGSEEEKLTVNIELK